MTERHQIRGFAVTGTDTDVGKTIVAAMLVAALKGIYYKPVQAGLEDGTDTLTVKRLSGLPSAHFIEEKYRLNTPASPHLAAEIDGIEIDVDSVSQLPAVDKTIIVEGAGGVLVPVTRSVLFADLFKSWNLPVIICARTTLGTINHTLLTISELRHRHIPVHGIVFVGDHHAENERIIPSLAQVRNLGRLPFLQKLNSSALRQAFKQNFKLKQFK